jgi:hypothetical protein
MTTSQPENTTAVGASAPSANVEETVSLSNEAAPVAALGGDASTSSAAASYEQSSAETAPVLIETTAGPSTTADHDPAPIQPPIQAVSVSESCYGLVYSVVFGEHHINTITYLDNLLKYLQDSDFDESDSAYGDSDHLSDTTSIPSIATKMAAVITSSERESTGDQTTKFRTINLISRTTCS